MAQFVVGNALGKAATRHGGLRRLLWRADFALVWLLVNGCSLLPPDRASSLGSRLGLFIGPRLRRKTAMLRENLSRAFPEWTPAAIERLIERIWANAGRILAEFPHLSALLESRDRQRLHVVLEDGLELDGATPPRIVVGAHLGNWEIISAALQRRGIPCAALYTPPTNPLLDRMLYRSRRRFDCELVPRERAARGLMRHIGRGRTAALLIDRRVDDGPEVPFFGLPKPSTLLPAKLALKFGIELLPVRVRRLRGAELQVALYPPVKAAPHLAGAPEDERALDMIAQIHRRFESWIEEEPAEWFCPKRIWPKQARRVAARSDGEAGSRAA